MGGILQSLLASLPSSALGLLLYGWGSNSPGTIGDNTTVSKSSPVQVGALEDWLVISAGTYESAAVKNDGTLWTWGRNGYGQLGHNDTTNRSSPVQVGALTNWASVAISSRVGGGIGGACLALKTDGTIWGWGDGYVAASGGFGNQRSSPVQIGSDTNWASIFQADGAAFAIKTTGALYAWGKNQFGMLGLNNLNNVSSPVQLGASTNWASVGIGDLHTIATKTDGTLWAIGGRNVNGQLGLGNTTNRSSPIQIGALTDWGTAQAAPSTSGAIKTNNTLWMWGWNYYGWLGLNDRTQRNSPVQVGSLTNWSVLACAQYNTLAVKTNGTLWAVGGGQGGTLGLGDLIKRSSPVQVGADTDWETISGNSGGTVLALKKA